MTVSGAASLSCYRHHDRATGVACTRCGRPICPECMNAASVGFHCPECVREGQASVRRPRQRGVLGRFAGRWGLATTTLVGLNVAMYLLTAILALPNGGGLIENSSSTLFQDLALIPFCTTEGCVVGGAEPWRLLSSAFLHYGLFHLVMNMLALLVLGVDLERYLGRARFVAVYLVSALFGGAAVTLFADPFSATVGASGGVFGLLGAAVVILRANGGDLRPLISVLVLNLVISLLPGISLLGHLGGLVGGMLAAGLLVATRRNVTAQWVGLAVLVMAPFVATLG